MDTANALRSLRDYVTNPFRLMALHSEWKVGDVFELRASHKRDHLPQNIRLDRFVGNTEKPMEIHFVECAILTSRRSAFRSGEILCISPQRITAAYVKIKAAEPALVG